MDDKTIVITSDTKQNSTKANVKNTTDKANSKTGETKRKDSSKSVSTKQKTTSKTRAKKMKIGIVYNAPVTLTYSFLCVAVMLFHQYVIKNGTLVLFVAPGAQGSEFAFNWQNPLHYFRLILHVIGHADWSHLISNLCFLLLLGPILEERFGSKLVLLMMLITAFVTGVINACFIPYGLMGASGIVFMMILLSSFTTIDRKKIPITFILVVALYLGREFLTMSSSADAGISTMAHIAGGICGSLFGFLATTNKQTKKYSSK